MMMNGGRYAVHSVLSFAMVRSNLTGATAIRGMTSSYQKYC